MSSRPLMTGYFRAGLVLDVVETERPFGAFALRESFCLDRAYYDAGTATAGSLWPLANESDYAARRDLVVPSQLYMTAAPGVKRVVRRLWELDPAVRLWALDRRKTQMVLRQREQDAERVIAVVELDAVRYSSTTAACATVCARVLNPLRSTRHGGHRRHPGLLIYRRSDRSPTVPNRTDLSDLYAHSAGPAQVGGSDKGGALSWCVLPLRAAWAEMAQAIRKRRNVVAGGAW